MTANESLNLSSQIKDLLQTDLSYVFKDDIPVNLIESKARELNANSRARVFTPVNTILTMLVSATQEDKSLQNGLNIFKYKFEHHCKEVSNAEAAELLQEKIKDAQSPKKSGRPKKFLSRLLKSHQKPLCNNTAGYSTARKRLDTSLVQTVYEHSCNFGDLDNELWHGMKTYIGDGTYLQLQDTEDIKEHYAVKNMEDSYPQALLQVLIRQGSGQISQFAISSRQKSELVQIVPMIEKLEKNSLLLLDDLYNSYYHFCCVIKQECHIIVSGKRKRKYKIVRTLHENDQIVELSKTSRPDYVSQEDWENLPDKILLRRITYTYPTKKGLESAVLYTTIINPEISTVEIVTKHSMRWDIEISIREIKTIMDINILRSKSCDMLLKELLIALSAYNLIRKIIAKSADKVGFSPQKDIFQKYSPFGRTVLLDKKGRVFFRWSPGRYGYTDGTNQ